MAFCTECGFKNADSAKFCQNCGAKFSSVVQSVALASNQPFNQMGNIPPPPSVMRASVETALWEKLQPNYQIHNSTELAEILIDLGVPSWALSPIVHAMEQGGCDSFYTVVEGALTSDVEVHLLDTEEEQREFFELPRDVLESRVKKLQDDMYSATNPVVKSQINRQLAIMAGGVFEIRVRADNVLSLEKKLNLTKLYLEVAREILRRCNRNV